MFCENCGQQIEDGSTFCVNCGATVTPGQQMVVNTEPMPAEVPAPAAYAVQNSAPQKLNWVVVLLAAFVIPVAVFVYCLVSGGLSEYKAGASSSPSSSNSGSKTNSEQEDDVFNDPGKLMATASSTVGYNMWGENFTPASAVDRDPETAWYEGVDGLGIGEWLRLDFNKCKVSGISIINGQALAKNNYSRYYVNSRLKEIKIEAEGGFSETFSLRDRVTTFQELQFKKPVVTSWIKITILDVYPATDDEAMTGISEVKLF